jgi:methylmalonyl-CoA mutase
MTCQSSAPFRALTAVALCDGHDAAIVAVSRALRQTGFEVIYIGFNKTPGEIVRAAIDEDVDVIGISSYNGGHAEFLQSVLAQLAAEGSEIPVVAGGGGTITPSDERELLALGVARIFPPGMTMAQMAAEVAALCAERRESRTRRDLAGLLDDVRAGNRPALARALTLVEGDGSGDDAALDAAVAELLPEARPLPVVGITGNGGAGKSTLIDELLLRLTEGGALRVGVLCCDPTTQQTNPEGKASGGALLGDRIRMLAADRDNVFIRSLATRHHQGGVSGSLARAVRVLSAAPLDLVILESAGIGQADNPFAGMVDVGVFVMTSEFGSALQLEKSVMLEQADIVVLNKCDQPAAPAALKSVQARLRTTGRATELFGVIASRHRDPGVDRLCEAVRTRAGVGGPATEEAIRS